MVKQSVEESVVARNNANSKYRGVRKRKWGKWVSEIRLPNSRERIWLGSYDSAEKAARAFDAAMFCLRGGGANFNFPDNPPDIAGGRSMNPTQIQAAAARFANSEPQRDVSGQPVNNELGAESSSEGTVLPMESSSPPLSDMTVQTDISDVTLNGSFPDLFPSIGSSNYAPDYSMFPGFDDFGSDFYVPEMASVDYYGEENMDGLIIQDPYLWNF